MMILWVDFETTGLVPADNFMLEMAAILTDSTLEEVDGNTSVLHFDDDTMRLTFDPYVQDMHTENGLWNACKESTRRLTEVEMIVLQMLKDAGVGPQVAILGGSTINFDRAWMEYWMPSLFNYLNYHNLDVSSLKRCAELWRPDIVGKTPESSGIHRAGPDIIGTIELMKIYRDFMICPKERHD